MIKLPGTTQAFLAVKQSSPFDCDKSQYIVMYINRISDGIRNTEYAVHNYNSANSEFFSGVYTTDYVDAMKAFNSRGYCQS